MRGKNGYAKVLRVIESCKEKVSISVMFTLSPYNNFEDMRHVIKVCKGYGIDVRIGVYNDISFFDTKEKAHETEVGSMTGNAEINNADFKKLIPFEVRDTNENYDFLLLYDEWRKGNAKLKCRSILDSIVIHPNGDVPICQNLNMKLGNVHERSLDDIFNSIQSQEIQRQFSSTCNKCWVNFHRKYDFIMMRTIERFAPKKVVESIFGKYQWSANRQITYRKFMKNHQ
jgi:MoaA/NifB/PqqE/SkfB family radical SAM enzyme